MLSHCFCFFSAAGLAANLVILHFATMSCWAFFFSAVRLSYCFCFFSAAGLAGNLSTEQKSMVLKFVSSETKYVNVIVHLRKNHPHAMDSKKNTSRPTSTGNKNDEVNVIWLNNRQIKHHNCSKSQCRHWQLSMEHPDSTLHPHPIIHVIFNFRNSRSKLLLLNTPLWHNGLVVVFLVTKFPLINRNITPTGVPNIIFQNTNDVIIHHAPIKPITPNEIITTTEIFVDFLSQCFTNRSSLILSFTKYL